MGQKRREEEERVLGPSKSPSANPPWPTLCPTEKDPKLEIRYRHKKSRERDSNERDGSEPRDEGGGRKRPTPDPDLQRRAGSGTGVGAMLARGSASPHKSSPQPLVATPSQVSGCGGWDT